MGVLVRVAKGSDQRVLSHSFGLSADSWQARADFRGSWANECRPNLVIPGVAHWFISRTGNSCSPIPAKYKGNVQFNLSAGIHCLVAYNNRDEPTCARTGDRFTPCCGRRGGRRSWVHFVDLPLSRLSGSFFMLWCRGRSATWRAPGRTRRPTVINYGVTDFDGHLDDAGGPVPMTKTLDPVNKPHCCVEISMTQADSPSA